MPTYLDPNAGRPARLLQWNIGLQREINRNLVVEASFVGNRGVWWTANSLPTVNFLSQDVLTSSGFHDFTSAAESRLLTTTVSSLTAAQRSTLAARGITGLPYANFPSNQSVRQSLLPFPQYSQQGTGFFATVGGSPLGDTWYDSFQLNVTQRFSHGLSFNMNYNYSKSLELMNSPDVFNRSLGKDLGAFDLPHQFRFTAQYQVPRLSDFGTGVFSNKIVSYVLSDWGVGAYLNYQSGPVVGRPSSNGSVSISQFLGRGPGSAQLKKNADGGYMNPWSVDWTDYSGTHHTDPIDINCHCFDPTKTIVLNPNAWDNVPDGQWAADNSTLRFYRGFRQPVENANFSRSFRITERVNLNVRVEFNNVFNRMQLPARPRRPETSPVHPSSSTAVPIPVSTAVALARSFRCPARMACVQARSSPASCSNCIPRVSISPGCKAGQRRTHWTATGPPLNRWLTWTKTPTPATQSVCVRLNETTGRINSPANTIGQLIL